MQTACIHTKRSEYISDLAVCLEFCKWLNGNRGLHRDILFIGEAQFNWDGVNNTHKSHVWSDGYPHATVYMQLQCNVSVWCGDLDDQLIGPFIFEDYSLYKKCSHDFCRSCTKFGGRALQ